MPPDGYTILITGDPVTSSPHLVKVAYDLLKDLRPVIQLTRQPAVMVVHPSLGAGSIEDLVRIAQKQPELTYGTAGAGTNHHILGAWFAKQAGVNLVHVPYRGGGAAINDLIAGHIKIGLVGSTPIVSHHSTGTLKALAQLTSQRSASLPDVPTFAEAGYPSLVIDQWLAAFVPAGTSNEIVERFNVEMARALADPEVRDKLAKSALEPVGGSPADLSQLVRTDLRSTVD